MSRKDILSSPEYWIAKAQIDLYNHAEDFMEKNNMNRSQLAQHLGVSKGYVSQLLNGDYDHKLSKFIELAIAFGYMPKIEFQPIEEVVSLDRYEYVPSKPNPNIKFIKGNFLTGTNLDMNPGYESPTSEFRINVA